MNYLDKANSLRAFLAQNSLPRLKRKRYGQDGLEKKKDPWEDHAVEWITKDYYDSLKLSPEEAALRFRAGTPSSGYSSKYIGQLRESDAEYQARKKEQRELIEEKRAKKLKARNPTQEELDYVNTYIKKYNSPDFKWKLEDPERRKVFDIFENTNIQPVGYSDNLNMYNTNFDFSKSDFPLQDEYERELARYCPGCGRKYRWNKNIYPTTVNTTPTSPQFSIKGITADQYVIDPKTYGLGTNSPEAKDYRYRIETDKGFDILPSKKAFEDWKTKYAKEYQPYYTANTGKAPVLYNQTGPASYNETPTLKYEEAPTLVKKYGGTIYKKKSKLKQTYLNKYK